MRLRVVQDPEGFARFIDSVGSASPAPRGTPNACQVGNFPGDQVHAWTDDPTSCHGRGRPVRCFFLIPSVVEAQDGARFRVLVPDLFDTTGDDRRFGERTADELRELLDGLATHQPVEEREIRESLRQFKLDMRDLDCIKTRQLGTQMNAQVAICASYIEAGEQRDLSSIEVWDLGSGESFQIDGFSVARDGQEDAAQRIFAAFDRYNQQHRFTVFCSEYMQSEQWENALRNCEQALELNPGSISTLLQKGQILWKLERLEDALMVLEEALEIDPFKEDGLQLAGYLATQLGRNDEGREYYGRYLEVNPGDIAVRRRIAYEIFEAGDPEGSMLFIDEGLQVEQSPDLLQDFGGYAFAAAVKAGEGAEAGGPISAEVAEFYRGAIDAYLKVFEAKGAEMEVSPLRNVVNAYVQLEQFNDAIQLAERVLETHANEASLWNAYAQALQRVERVDDALNALLRVEEIDPTYPDIAVRQASLLITAQRFDESVPLLRKAVEGGEDPNRVSRMILADANTNGLRANNYDYAIRLLEVAISFEVSQEQKEELDFFLGYSLLMSSRGAQEPQTLQSAQATLPRFQRALRLLSGARAYDQRNGGRMNLGQLLEATNTYIEIQEAIILRGG